MNKIGRWLGAILIVAVALRAGAAVYMGDRVVDMPGIFDQISYDGLAQRVAAGHGFSFGEDWWPATRAGEPTAHWSFLYTLYLAAAYVLAGHHPLLPRLMQALAVGVLMPLLTYSLGARVAGRTVGLIAAGISAIYIYFFYYAAALMTEALFLITVLGSLLLAMVVIDRPTLPYCLALGVAMGCAVLLRQTFLLFVPVLLLWVVWARRGRVPWFRIALPVGVAALLILPWTIRNYLAFHQLVLLNTNAGYVFFWSNHPIHGTDWIPLLGTSGGPNYTDLIPPELLRLDEAALEKALFARGVSFVVNDPIRYILLSLGRIPDYFMFWPSATSSMLSNISRVGSIGIFLPFMVYGVVVSIPLVWARRWHLAEDATARARVLLYLFIVLYSGVHVLTWAGLRYRLPVDSVLVIFAALGLYDLYQRVQRRGVRFRPVKAAS